MANLIEFIWKAYYQNPRVLGAELLGEGVSGRPGECGHGPYRLRFALPPGWHRGHRAEAAGRGTLTLQILWWSLPWTCQRAQDDKSSKTSFPSKLVNPQSLLPNLHRAIISRATPSSRSPFAISRAFSLAPSAHPSASPSARACFFFNIQFILTIAHTCNELIVNLLTQEQGIHYSSHQLL